MKLTSLALILAASLNSNPIFALEKCTSSMGNVIINQVTLGCMSINGSASLTGTKFTGDLMLTGPLKASQVKFQGVNVTGAVSLDSSQVLGDAHIIGPLQATATTFQKNLTINAVDILLTDATTKDIIVESSQPSTLLLTNTTVNGNIVFKGAHGTITNVHSTIHGKVINP
jgi:hypothetical protein